MAKQTIPPSVTLLQTVSGTLVSWIDWANDEGDKWEAVRSGIATAATPEATLVLQTLLLTTLTMFEGVGTPSIAGVNQTKDGITIRWVGASSDTLTWGVANDAFIRFSHYVAQRVLGRPNARNKTTLPTQLLPAISTRLAYYLSALEITEKRLILIQTDIRRGLEGDVDLVFLFILLSCLPLDQLNALFLHIQQFLPDDLKIKSASGQSVMVSQLFQPATDVRFMVEKTSLYMDLFTTPQLPIIREITRAKTVDYFQKLMQATSVRDGVLENLRAIVSLQISPRTQLYTLCQRLISRIQK
ncbi:hypothetical protein EBR57_04430 [bacterium]|nr:hypothetical protein [bacterium]